MFVSVRSGVTVRELLSEGSCVSDKELASQCGGGINQMSDSDRCDLCGVCVDGWLSVASSKEGQV